MKPPTTLRTTRAEILGTVLVIGSAFAQPVLPTTTWEVRNPETRPAGRWGHSMAFFEPLGAVAVFGGGGATYDTSIWLWGGLSWAEFPSSGGPSGRFWSGLSTDLRRGRLVLFGGSRVGLPLNDTWEFDGSRWQEILPTQRPEPRDLFPMVYDPLRQNIILFGGAGVRGLLEPLYDTWTWDGTNWTRRATGPNPRTSHAMAWDGASGRVILFGGNGPSQAFGDTWAWDGTAWWLLTPPVSPPARGLHAMAWHEGRRRVVLFGGRGAAGQLLGDTWEFDGLAGTWQQVAPVQSPPPNLFPEMAYDRLRSRIVLFGGLTGSSPSDLTWTWLDRTLRAAPARPAPGQVVALHLDSPADPGRGYALACSFMRGPGLPVFPDGRVVSLTPDALFWWSLASQAPPFLGFLGALDALGRAQASILIPAEPALIGLVWFVSGVTFEPGSPRTILNEVGLSISAP